jgi:hypothetical protein
MADYGTPARGGSELAPTAVGTYMAQLVQTADGGARGAPREPTADGGRRRTSSHRPDGQWRRAAEFAPTRQSTSGRFAGGGGAP